MKEMINCKPGIKVFQRVLRDDFFFYMFTTHIYYINTCENFYKFQKSDTHLCVNSITLCLFCYTLVKFQEKGHCSE